MKNITSQEMNSRLIKGISVLLISGFTFYSGCNEKELNEINVTNIKPTSGVVGDIITAYGFFPNNIQALIGSTSLLIVDQAKDSIRFKIPNSVSAGIKSITLSNNDSDFGPIQFTLFPDVSGIDKFILSHNDEAVISGTGFSTTPSDNLISLDLKPITVIESSTTQVKVKIPENISLGEKKLKFQVSSLESQNQIDIRIFGWQKITNHPRGSFYSISSFSLLDDLYFVLGLNSYTANFDKGEFASELWKYNLSSKNWIRLKDFPGEKLRHEAAAFSINGKGYIGVGSGLSIGHLNDLWEYNPLTDSWEQLKNFPGLGRTAQVSFVLNGKAFIGTGISNGNTSHNDFYCFDPLLGEWKQIADYPGGKIYGASSLIINNNALVIGGVININQPFKEVWEYNTTTDKWTKRSDFPGDTPIELKSFGVNSFGYSGLGWIDANNPSKKIWMYDPINNGWTETNEFLGAERFAGTYGTIGKYGYHGFGYHLLNEYSDLWLYLPKDFTP